MVAAHSPDTSLGSHSVLIASSAWAAINRAAARRPVGAMPKATEPRSKISVQAARATSGRPAPPSSGGWSIPGQPAST